MTADGLTPPTVPDDHPPGDDPPTLPTRDPAGHKGTFGTVVIFGGCAAPGLRMIGAPALAALGALRAGAGLVRLAVPGPVLDPALTIAPSATGLPLAVDGAGHLLAHEAVALFDAQASQAACLIVGPGLGPGAGPRALALRAVQQEECPVVIDADALNALAEIPELFRDFHASAVLTPHPGEFRRLAQVLRITHDPTDEAARPLAAADLARRLGCIVVLKGKGTVVSDGHRHWICRAGHACLATGGTGDVLSGVIAGLIAQFVRAAPPRSPATGDRLDLFDAARAGVQAHALASERWAASRRSDSGLLAVELAGELPPVIAGLRRG
ncbi:MAG: NAD(P)H-hydrate dehydratase [Phycisphaerales bacterium]|nr:NAD(P)H-hydrate dehydratase [Phycisphaerales bacterium]